MKYVKTSSPGKCILFGEHAVVYDYPAIAMAISKRSTCTIQNIKNDQIELSLENFNYRSKFSNYNDLISNILPKFKNISVGFEIFHEKFDLNFKNIRINLSSELISGAGLGSSASIAISLISAISEYYGLNLEKKIISELAYEIEKTFHGTPSGIDNTICTFGNLIFFHKGDYRLIDIPQELAILITFTKMKHNTKSLVKQVRELKEKKPMLVNLILEKIGSYTEIAELELTKGNYREVGNLMNSNQKLLAELNLSNQVIDLIVQLSNDNGAFGSKLTGAGLGGCVISLGKEDILKRIDSFLLKTGFKSFISKLDGDGVRVETSK